LDAALLVLCCVFIRTAPSFVHSFVKAHLKRVSIGIQGSVYCLLAFVPFFNTPHRLQIIG